MIRVEDVGELGYGAVFAGANWWDNQRITEGKLANSDVFKKAGFWAYVGIGLPATLASAMNWMPRQRTWIEHVSHGFLFYLPSFLMDTAKALSKPKTTQSSAAIAEANRVLRQARTQAPIGLPPGRSVNDNVTLPRFEGSRVY